MRCLPGELRPIRDGCDGSMKCDVQLLREHSVVLRVLCVSNSDPVPMMCLGAFVIAMFQ